MLMSIVFAQQAAMAAREAHVMVLVPRFWPVLLAAAPAAPAESPCSCLARRSWPCYPSLLLLLNTHVLFNHHAVVFLCSGSCGVGAVPLQEGQHAGGARATGEAGQEGLQLGNVVDLLQNCWSGPMVQAARHVGNCCIAL
jgi:hypothetical protein